MDYSLNRKSTCQWEFADSEKQFQFSVTADCCPSRRRKHKNSFRDETVKGITLGSGIYPRAEGEEEEEERQKSPVPSQQCIPAAPEVETKTSAVRILREFDACDTRRPSPDSKDVLELTQSANKTLNQRYEHTHIPYTSHMNPY
ncbi:Hypothetical predicted protein [Scomber scombrus]|uniref:Uncharacterized protein n=1 Tax=Scomber scombrus TaxID=13677 RepID=A0AAV1PII6_SCOSC